MLSWLISALNGQTSVPRGTRDGQSHIDGVPDELAIQVDRHGSPVSVEPAEWFVCFVPGLQKQWWHRFTNAKHKHVFAMKMVSEDKWILFEPWWTRIVVSALTLDEAVKFLRWGAVGNILQVREAVPGSGSQTRGWSNCTVLISFLLGRSYRTWTPHGLYRRLAAEPDARPIGLPEFLQERVLRVATETANRSFETFCVYPIEPLDRLLIEAGRRLMAVMMSSPAISLHRLAVSESVRFPSASQTYYEHGPKRGVDHVKSILETARRRRHIEIVDCEVGARQFISMLRGNLHLQVMLGLREAPGVAEIDERVGSVVQVFLHGVLSANWQSAD